MSLTKVEWHRKYRELLVSMAGMTKQQAFDYTMENKHFFDSIFYFQIYRI